MVVNEKADRQHAIASALELPSTWAKKVDYYNLGVHMADTQCRFRPMHDLSGRQFAELLHDAYLLLNNGRIKTPQISAFNICGIHIPYILHMIYGKMVLKKTGPK